MYEIVFSDVDSPVGLRGVSLTVEAASRAALPEAIAESFTASGLGTSRADMVEIEGTGGALAFTPPTRAADDTASFGGHAAFTVR